MKKAIATLAVFSFILLIIIAPDICINGAQKGLLICGNVIIPSLFPFAACVLFIMKTDCLLKLKIIKPIAKILFNQTEEMFCVMLFSMLGGYPVGARLINQLCIDKKVSPENAHIMQCYCVNAGPAFILVAVGVGILNSKPCGALLLLAHLLSSVIIALFCSRFIKYNNTIIKLKKRTISLSDCIVESVSDAASSTLSICSYVILFSVLNSYLLSVSNDVQIFKVLSSLCEVTSAVANIQNIYIISFLLGFSGIAVWFQVLACSKRSGVNLPLFISFRILHGVLSTFILFIFLRIFKISVSTVSNNISFKLNYTYSGVSLAFSLAIMIILLLISVNCKNHGGNPIKDML